MGWVRDIGEGRRQAIVAVTAAGLCLSACTSSTDLLGSSDAASSGSSGSFRERMSAMLFGATPAPPPANPTAPGVRNTDIECPGVEIRQGTSTLTASVTGAEPSAMNLRYQVSIGQTARECAALGATLTIKVGVQGRVIMGPAGSPGQIEVPLRLALVREGIEPKTIWSKLYKVPVAVQPGQTNIPFLHIEEDLTVPLPSATELDAYVVYVGFDPNAPKTPSPKPAKKTRQKS